MCVFTVNQQQSKRIVKVRGCAKHLSTVPLWTWTWTCSVEPRIPAKIIEHRRHFAGDDGELEIFVIRQVTRMMSSKFFYFCSAMAFYWWFKVGFYIHRRKSSEVSTFSFCAKPANGTFQFVDVRSHHLNKQPPCVVSSLRRLETGFVFT